MSKALAEKGAAMSKYLEMAAPFGKMALQWAQTALPYVITGCERAYEIYTYLPVDILMAIIGVVLCFCGMFLCSLN
jgi:hypothetical protein